MVKFSQFDRGSLIHNDKIHKVERVGVENVFFVCGDKEKRSQVVVKDDPVTCKECKKK